MFQSNFGINYLIHGICMNALQKLNTLALDSMALYNKSTP
jgi:hypothetical protein